MTILQMLYQLLIGPLELLFEVIFVIANRKVSNPAYAIIALSLAMNFLVLPLYRRADAMQAEERDREEKMRPWIDHIKKTFSGDERFMMLQEYYRQNDYRPTDVFKGSVSLFLEIPFFIAAYRFLSGLEILRGVSFGPIKDLGMPDALIHIGGMTINFLPILMTAINIIAAAVYMKGMPLRNKIQTYGIAAIFLVLLYNSPAGLVFYWTLNQIFSLCKNIVYYFAGRKKTEEVPEKKALFDGAEDRATTALFRASAGTLTAACGLLIPSALINDSTDEFLELTKYYSPDWYIVSAFLLAAGTFIIWFGVFYSLADKKGKKVICVLTTIAAVAGMCDYMLFSNGFGTISPDLEYDSMPVISKKMKLINLAVIIIIAVFIYLIYRYKKVFLTYVVTASFAAVVIMSGMNIVQINNTLTTEKDRISKVIASEPEFVFSKNGRNVVVIMMDRLPGFYIPYIMNEKPELKGMFSGFTYYPNALSYGTSTNGGTPPIYGGYDYTPENMNARSDEWLVDKHNEALKVMPELFGNDGFDVTIANPTYAGYQITPDLSIYDDHPEYHTYILNKRYDLEEYGYYSTTEMEREARLRNFFCYSIFRMAPSLIEKTLYQKGNYNSSSGDRAKSVQTREGYSIAHGYKHLFMSNYAILNSFPSITTVNNDSRDHFLMLSNDATHESMLLQEPEYLPAMDVDNTEYDKEHPDRSDGNGNTMEFDNDHFRLTYHVSVASLVKLGEWLDYLKEQGVYDNTRIIIVSDHGPKMSGTNEDYFVRFTDEETGKKERVDIRRFNCTLLYKDFDAEGFTVDDRFATNADTPALALDGIVEDPVNPFTGDPITVFSEDRRPVHVAKTANYKVSENNGRKFIPSWTFEVGKDPLNVSDWKYIGKY